MCNLLHLKSADFLSKVIEFLLGLRIFLRHFLKFGLPFVSFLLESLYFTLEMAGFDVGLAEPGDRECMLADGVHIC